MFTITESERQGEEANVFTEVLQKKGGIFARLIGGRSDCIMNSCTSA
jgi:hypothetical protein